MAEGPQRKKRVCEDDTAEFIKTLKRSEYSIVEQLKKQPTQISILSRFLSSETHCDGLLKILKSLMSLRGIAMKDLEQIVEQVIGTNTITFNKDELIPEGMGHAKSLHNHLSSANL